MIYLDNAATTFPKPDSVYVGMDKANREYAVNAGRGSYKAARKAAKVIDNTRLLIRKLVAADITADVVFAPSITVALNQVIKRVSWQNNDIVYISPYEYNAVARTVNSLSNIKVIELPINKETFEIDIEKMKYMFTKDRPKAVFCTHISNVTGYILPVEEVFSAAKEYDAITVLDSAQSLGLVEVDSKKIGADIIAFAGHKTLYGPLGIGGFINISNIPLNVVLTGGTGTDSLNLDMPEKGTVKYESSSFNIVAIAGLYEALKCLDVDENNQHEKVLTDYLVDNLNNIKDLICYVPVNRNKHIGILSFVIHGYKSDDVGMILDEDYDIAVRTGYHCAPYIHKYLNDKEYLGTIRMGVSRFNSKEDVEQLIKSIKELIR